MNDLFIICSFEDNKAISDEFSAGGAILDYGGLLQISNCSFRGNRAWATGQYPFTWGGAIYSDADVTDIKDSTFIDNEATEAGGALAFEGEGQVELSGCSFISNSQTDWIGRGGGAISLLSSQAIQISRCNFESNFSAWYGGALVVWGIGTIRS